MPMTISIAFDEIRGITRKSPCQCTSGIPPLIHSIHRWALPGLLYAPPKTKKKRSIQRHGISNIKQQK